MSILNLSYNDRFLENMSFEVSKPKSYTNEEIKKIF